MLPGNLFQCLIDHGKKLFACRLHLERGLRNNIELASPEVWGKGVRYKSLSNHWFIVPFAVRRLNCRIPYKLWYIQGVPKVRSSNFMHCNFLPTLYFYMKFLEDVYFSVEYMFSEFQSLACPFYFFVTFCSRCGMEWDTACRPTDDPFWAFLSPGAQEPVHPPNNICLV